MVAVSKEFGPMMDRGGGGGGGGGVALYWFLEYGALGKRCTVRHRPSVQNFAEVFGEQRRNSAIGETLQHSISAQRVGEGLCNLNGL